MSTLELPEAIAGDAPAGNETGRSGPSVDLAMGGLCGNRPGSTLLDDTLALPLFGGTDSGRGRHTAAASRLDASGEGGVSGTDRTGTGGDGGSGGVDGICLRNDRDCCLGLLWRSLDIEMPRGEGMSGGVDGGILPEPDVRTSASDTDGFSFV